MGTDIHGFIRDKESKQIIITLENAELDDRNYTIFAMLADVRNGFEGELEPLSDPKGIPYDIYLHGDNEMTVPSKHRPRYSFHEDDCNLWLGDHSHTFFTLQELIDFFKSGKNATFLEKNIDKKNEVQAFIQKAINSCSGFNFDQCEFVIGFDS